MGGIYVSLFLFAPFRFVRTGDEKEEVPRSTVLDCTLRRHGANDNQQQEQRNLHF